VGSRVRMRRNALEMTQTIQSFLDSYAVPYVLHDSTETKKYANIAAEAMRYTVLLECAR
jgi:hypothetical protein